MNNNEHLPIYGPGPLIYGGYAPPIELAQRKAGRGS